VTGSFHRLTCWRAPTSEELEPPEPKPICKPLNETTYDESEEANDESDRKRERV
jgi:hypothetical protein